MLPFKRPVVVDNNKMPDAIEATINMLTYSGTEEFDVTISKIHSFLVFTKGMDEYQAFLTYKAAVLVIEGG